MSFIFSGRWFISTSSAPADQYCFQQLKTEQKKNVLHTATDGRVYIFYGEYNEKLKLL